MYGYWGKLLQVDLTHRTHRIEDIPEEVFDLLLGGSALGAKFCWRNSGERGSLFTGEQAYFLRRSVPG